MAHPSKVNSRAMSGVRQTYARVVLAMAGIANDAPLENALAQVSREFFLPDPPWFIANANGVFEIYSTDPAAVYQDSLFVLDEGKNINNGSPSLHAWALHRLKIVQNQTVAHLGAGTGYYTAIIAHLVGKTGKVLGIEVDKQLSASALANLQDMPHVTIINGSGSAWPQEPVDAIYVNYAVTRPPVNWFLQLNEGGKLIFPLGVPALDSRGQFENFTSFAALVLVERQNQKLMAKYLTSVNFICDAGANTPEIRKEINALERSFKSGGIERISQVRLGPQKGKAEWYSADSWGLIAENTN